MNNILRAKNDAGDTLAELADNYKNPLYKFCRSLTYSKEDADDLFQETFLKVFERFERSDKISGTDNPQAFLFSTALYIWRNWKRKYARRKRLAPSESLDELYHVASEISIEDDFNKREQIQTVRGFVESLPEKLRIPVIMYYAVEMDISEIAEALKIPGGTVKSRLFTARKTIEKKMIEKGLSEN